MLMEHMERESKHKCSVPGLLSTVPTCRGSVCLYALSPVIGNAQKVASLITGMHVWILPLNICTVQVTQ